MRRTATLMAALAAILTATAATVRTATENFVTNKIEEIRTNTYTRAETDARIAELAPRTSLEPATNYTDNAVEIAYHNAVDYIDRVARRIEPKILTTNDVCGIVTNEEIVGYTEWRKCDGWIDELESRNEEIRELDDGWYISYEYIEDEEWYHDMVGPQDYEPEGDYKKAMRVYFGSREWFERKPITRNTLGLARLSDIAPIVSDTVTKEYVEDLGIESGVDAQTVTNMTALTPVYSQTPTFSGWTFTPPTFNEYPISALEPEGSGGIIPIADSEEIGIELSIGTNTMLVWSSPSDWYGDIDLTATRVRTDVIGYTLGTQTNSVLAATNSLISASTITNLAPTRAEVEAGWWSEWTIRQPAGVRFANQPTYHTDPGDEEYSWWEATVIDGQGNEGFFTTEGGGSSSPELDEIRLTEPDPVTVIDEVIATRHRVAAPVPTKISDITNDVGYVSASTATNIAFAVSADATNSLSKSIAPTITNIASTVSSSAIASADTTYRHTIGLTNLNQSVQYVNITETAPPPLEIQPPTDGATKDWMVYVTSVTNVSLVLPPATYWMADTAYTNDVPPATPTALWFSQVTDGIFILGRQELTEVTAP